MSTRGKTIFAVGSVILIVAIRVLFILVHKNALALYSSKFGVFLIGLFDIALVSLSIWGDSLSFLSFHKENQGCMVFRFLCLAYVSLVSLAFLLYSRSVVPK